MPGSYGHQNITAMFTFYIPIHAQGCSSTKYDLQKLPCLKLYTDKQNIDLSRKYKHNLYPRAAIT